MSSKVTYRQQFTRCGKERCRKCREGSGHGPYWYAYWSENGRTISKYIGIRLPPEVEAEKQSVEDTPDGSSGVNTQINGAEISSNLTVEAGQHPLPEQLTTQVLRIYTLGQFRIDRLQGEEWEPISTRTWHRRRPRALLGCLLSSPGRRMGREQIMEALWPDLDIDTAANRLNGAVHELRQILEPGILRPASSRLLRLEREILELADRSQIWVDAEVFENLLNEAHTSSDQQQVEQLLEAAANLYGGDYLLEELYSEWAAPRREALRRNWIGLLLKLAELREARGALVSAMEPLNRLLATDPTDETAVQRLMILLTRLDRRGEALSTYRRLAARLQRTYESEPLPETKELFEALRQGHISKITDTSPLEKATARLKNQPSAPAKTQEATVEQGTAQPIDAAAAPQKPLPSANRAAERKKAAQPIVSFVTNSKLGRANQSPLIGRTRELGVMRQMLYNIEKIGIPTDASSSSIRTSLDSIQSGHQQHVLLLMGEAGIGKTRLAEELSQEADKRGWSVAWARSYEQEGTVPYRPWTELLRNLLQRVSAETLIEKITNRSFEEANGSIPHVSIIFERLSTWLPELRSLVPPQADKPHANLPPEQERLHQWEATLALLNGLSQLSPLLLILDDLHWADSSSRELLAYLTRHIHNQRILLVGTCRDVELTPTHSLRTLIADLRREQAIVTLSLQPLTQSQISSLLAHLPEKVVQSIQTQAAGNPFFAEELARVSEAFASGESNQAHALNNGERSHEIPGRPGSLPEGIAAVLERRLSGLSSECQSLLGKAAVLGGSFEFSQLLAMANEYDEDTLLDLLEEALRAGLLTEQGTGTDICYRFWHPLIVSHLYGRLSAARCAQLHRRAAASLIQTSQGREGDMAAAIIHHLSKGGNDTKQIAYYAEIAAHKAFSLAAYAEALQYYRLAVETLTDKRILLQDPIDEAAFLQACNTPVEGFDILHVARLLERISECFIVQGNYGAARYLYQGVLALRTQSKHTTTDDMLKQEAQIQALIWSEIGRMWADTGNSKEANICCQQGLEVMHQAGVTSGCAWACIHLQLGGFRWTEGNYDEARRFVLQALEMLEQSMESSQKFRLVSNEANSSPTYFQTRTERAVSGDPLELGRAHEILGVIDCTIGQYTEALNHMYIALGIFEQHDLVTAMARLCGNLGAVHAMKTENAIAATYLRRSLDLSERLGDIPNMALASGNLGEMASRAGKLLEAEEWFRKSLRMAEQIGDREHSTWCYVALALAQQNMGNLEGAAHSIREAYSLARSIQRVRRIGSARLAIGLHRIIQATVACTLTDSGCQPTAHPSPLCKRLLQKAELSLQGAVQTEGLEVELFIEGQSLLATVYFLRGEFENAKKQALYVLEQAQQYEIIRLDIHLQQLLGNIFAAQNNYEVADSYFQAAMKLAKEHEMHLDYARCIYNYGASLVKRSSQETAEHQQGRLYLEEAYETFQSCHAELDLHMAKHLLDRETHNVAHV